MKCIITANLTPLVVENIIEVDHIYYSKVRLYYYGCTGGREIDKVI